MGLTGGMMSDQFENSDNTCVISNAQTNIPTLLLLPILTRYTQVKLFFSFYGVDLINLSKGGVK